MLLGTLGALFVAQASIAGVVRDEETSRPVAGAMVTLAELNRATPTDTAGRYLFLCVPSGPQRIVVRTVGYAPCSLHALVPRSGFLAIDIAIHPEPIPMALTEVRGAPAVRGLDDPPSAERPDRESTIAAARNHPLLAEPDALLALAGGEVVMQPETPSGVHVRGAASDHTAYLVDGIPVLSPFHVGGLSSAWNPDALSRLRLRSGPSPGLPHSLSGAVEATTREPGERVGTQGSVSTTQARVTVDGPLGIGGVGFLVSARTGHLGFLAPRDEPAYLRGEVGDWLVKSEVPALGGRFRILGYDGEDEIESAAVAEADTGQGTDVARNRFAWHSRSLGAEWAGTVSRTTLRARVWRATLEAGSEWAAVAAPLELAAARRDAGFLGSAEWGGSRGATALELRFDEILTTYRTTSDSAAPAPWSIGARTPVTTASLRHARRLGPDLDLGLGASLAWHSGDLYPGPRVQLEWRPSVSWQLAAQYDRTHQFTQSLRNGESVVGAVFPVELSVGAGAPGVPVARCEAGSVSAEYRPTANARLGIRAYGRDTEDVLLVAPRGGQPFSTGAFVVGSGSSLGISLDAAWSAPRWGAVASYGLQETHLAYGDTSYVPDPAAVHVLEGGVTYFPVPTASIRLGAAAALGRRATTIAGGFEWEAYNLADQGAEFGGTPESGAEPLGATELPAYVRVDLGARKLWRLRVAGRDASVAVFGTITNLLGRKNVWTYSKNPSTGELAPVEMRPRAPLVVGLEWQF